MTTTDLAVVGLAVLTLVNLFLLLGLVRRLREMAGSAGSASSGLIGVPAVGTVVGQFRESTLDGGVVTDESLRDGTNLVIFLTSTCPPCRDVAAQLATPPPGLALPPTVLFLQSSADDPELAPMMGLLGEFATTGTVALIEPDGPAARALSVTGYPTALLVRDGVVAEVSFDFTSLLTPAGR